MAIKRRSIFFISICIYSLLCIFWPELGQLWSGFSDDSGLIIAFACFVHTILYHLLAYSFSSYCNNPGFLKTPFAISILVSIAYLGVPFLKYYGEVRYVEFDIELHYRLFALLVVCASIYMILGFYAKKWNLYNLKAQQILHQSVGSVFIPFMYLIFGASILFLIIGSLYLNLSVAQSTLLEAGFFISLYYFALFGDQNKSIWNELLLICGGLSITYFFGARSALLLAVLVVVFGRISRIRSRQKRKSMVLFSLLLIPIVIILILGPLTEMTKDRYGEISMNIELQRTDYVDFVGAASIAPYKENVFRGLYLSSLWAIPGGYIDKAGLDYSMEPFFDNNGWRSPDRREGYTIDTNDYPDSIFSSGAMVGGYVGALLLPLVWFGVFSIILSQFNNTFLLSIYLGSVPSMFNIEIAFWTIVPTLRNWFVTSIILFIVIKLACIFRPKYSAYRKRRK